MAEISNHSKGETPTIFQIFGNAMENSRWLGYVFVFGLISFFLFVLVDSYKYIRFEDFSKGLVFIGFSLFFSFGYIKFAKFYGKALQEGRRSAVIGLVFMLLLISILSGLIAWIKIGQYSESIVFWTTFIIFIFSSLSVLLLVIGLAVFWKDLRSGLKIY